jgi:glutathione peroxidase
VNGANRHPIYALLAGKPFAGGIKWNFTKFLVGRDGKLLNRFGPMTKPDSDVMVRAIESALAAK